MTPSLSGKKSRLKLKSSKKLNLKLKPSKIKTKKIKVDHDKANNAVRHSDSVNCVFCSKFRACDNINKKMSFVCNKFTRFDTKDNEIKPKKKPSTTIIIRDDERSERLSYEKMMDDFEKHSNMSPLPPDLKVDDRDIPQAKNFIEWTTGKRFLNITPFAKQIQVGLHAFAEWCPNPKCTDENYIFDIPKKHTVDQILERVTPLEWGVCPRCKYRKSQMFADGVKIPNELDLLVGQRSGKSAVTVMIASYTLHGFLKLQNAPQAFNLLANETLEGTLVALTATKARDLIYSKLEGYLKDTPWFKQYHGMLDEYGKKYGEELYRVRDMFASYRCRSLIIKAVDPDMRKLRGATRFFGAIDELGWFLSSEKGNAIKFDAKEIVKSMDNQFLTVREGYYDLLKQGMDGIITPMLCYISSPSSKKDLMVKAYLNSLDSETAVGFNYATWEFHPRMSKNTKAIAKKFKEDPIEAMRDFGAVPPNSSAPFISDIDHVKRIVEKNRFNTVRCTSKDITAPGGKIMRTGDLRIIAPKDNNKRIMALDSASVNNSFAIVLGYFDDVLHRPIFDTFVEIQNSKESELNYNAVFNDVISPLCEHFNVGIIVADRFQSNKFIHDIQEEYQIPGEIYSVKYKDFTDFKQDILNSNITIPKPEMTPKEIEETGGDNYPHNFRKAPVAHFLYQLITVQDMKKEVLKGEGLTDDLFRACVLAYSYLVDPQYREHCSGKSQTAIIKPAYISGILTSRGNARGTSASRAGTTSNSEVFVAIASRGR